MTRRCDRNRKRSKRRAIYCPIHSCHLDSVSRKYRIYSDKFLTRHTGPLLIGKYRTVPIKGEWLEAFWCQECQQKNWYYIRYFEDGTYETSLATKEIWHQLTGVMGSQGNPAVGELTRINASL